MTDERDVVRLIGANIRRLAKRRGITLARLADHAGIGRTTLWRILDAHDRGPSDPRLSTLAALVVVLEADISELFEPPAEPR